MKRLALAVFVLAFAATSAIAQDSTVTKKPVRRPVKKKPAATIAPAAPSPEKLALDSARKRAASDSARMSARPAPGSAPATVPTAAKEPVVSAPGAPGGAAAVETAPMPVPAAARELERPAPTPPPAAVQAAEPTPEVASPARTPAPTRMERAAPRAMQDEAPSVGAPHWGWRFGVGSLVHLKSLVPLAAGTNPNIVVSNPTMLTVDLDLRVAGPVRLYASGAGGVAQLAPSALFQLTTPSASWYPAYTGLGTGGLMLWPTFGSSLIQPFVRGGYGVTVMSFDFQGTRRNAILPTLDAGGGFRLESGRIGVILEGRFLSSQFKASTLPIVLTQEVKSTQNDLFVSVGVRVTP